eukprot:TRINITY_DN12401_c0_g1_i4.p1 TRINITY_DN12401_c0_g1~~TRINITY_DN12401_c0_g1_i4.p1  ORF type:complete len:113 (-),score=13.92 TRINITY_DN12401_c0_g1_i4:357-695(-)
MPGGWRQRRRQEGSWLTWGWWTDHFPGDLFNPRVRVIMAEERVCKSGKSSVIEIDSEDDAWDGTIDPLAFQQVREERQRLATIARLEAQNRAPESRTPCPGNTSAPADPSTG